MAYRFRLQSLLNLRQRRQEEAEAELARRLRQVEQARAAADQATRRVKTEEMALSRTISKGMLAADYQTRVQHLGFLREEQARRRARLARLETEVHKARHLLIKRHGELKVVERLRRRDNERFLAEERRIQQKEADDLACIGFSHGQKGGFVSSPNGEELHEKHGRVLS